MLPLRRTQTCKVSWMSFNGPAIEKYTPRKMIMARNSEGVLPEVQITVTPRERADVCFRSALSISFFHMRSNSESIVDEANWKGISGKSSASKGRLNPKETSAFSHQKVILEKKPALSNGWSGRSGGRVGFIQVRKCRTASCTAQSGYIDKTALLIKRISLHRKITSTSVKTKKLMGSTTFCSAALPLFGSDSRLNCGNKLRSQCRITLALQICCGKSCVHSYNRLKQCTPAYSSDLVVLKRQFCEALVARNAVGKLNSAFIAQATVI